MQRSFTYSNTYILFQANENNFGFLSLVKQACLSNGHVIPIVESEGEGKGGKRDLDTFLK